MKSTRPGPDSAVPRRLRMLGVLAGLLLTSGAFPALAEVSVVTDARGLYVRTLVLSDAQGSRRLYWSQVRRGVDRRFLINPSGDRMGDGAPVIGERPGTHQPWIVWSAGDGHDREIAFATWVQGRWQGPAMLEGHDNSSDDLNPRLAFDSQGRPVVTWWRDESIPRVYLSMYRDGAFTPPLAISDPTQASRFPTIRVQGNQAVITFHTSRGQTVLYQDLTEWPIQLDGNGPLDGPVPPPDAQPGPGDGSPGEPGLDCNPDCPEIPVQKPSRM